MSVLIKGMEMPKKCGDCPCMDVNQSCCGITFDDVSSLQISMQGNCPLVEFSLPRGEWTDVSEKVWVSEIGFTSAWECSNCHTIFPFYSNYCPNCGAKMKVTS